MKLLVVGYGNELRGDDGAGPRVARAVEGWGLPGVVAVASHGLVPELADMLSRADRVVFVDARLAASGGGVEMVELTAGGPSSLGHVSDPRWLLSLAEAACGRRPPAWLVTVPAASFELGEGLSPLADRGVIATLGLIRELTSEACTSPSSGSMVP